MTPPTPKVRIYHSVQNGCTIFPHMKGYKLVSESTYDLESIREKTIHGMPLTTSERRYLVEKATGRPLPPPRKRCPICDANGQLPAEHIIHLPAELRSEVVMPAGVQSASHFVCPMCQGDGYVQTS